jgi:tRNA(Ile)-lysidine synthase
MLLNQSFLDYLNHQCGIERQEKLLVAVSGGADSMALLRLLSANGFAIEAAHVNFSLRGLESDGDEQLVIDFCGKLGVPLHVTRFDTKSIAKATGKSIEMAARDLRYHWFAELIEKHGFAGVAVGHHANDSIETFFINLLRGTGVHGLTGIKPRNGNVVRPLLFASRNDILDYCRVHDVPWRTDSSNLSPDHVRNRIRNEIMPLLMAINPSFEQTMLANTNRLGQLEALVSDMVEQSKESMVAEADGMTLIPIKLLKAHRHKSLLLFELLNDKGFNPSQIEDVLAGLDGIAGKQYLSASHRVVRDRDNLIVAPRHNALNEEFYVEGDQTYIDVPVSLSLRHFERNDDFLFSKIPTCVHFDADRVDFPLTIRQWRQGDVFMPLGMSNFKKLSDFYIDNKFSLVEKEKTWLLLSGDDIIWVIGHRLDDRYKVTPRTKRILEIVVGLSQQ